MRRIFLLLLPMMLIAPPFVAAQDKPAIVVHNFTATPGQPWPYDMRQMAAQTVAELQRKDGKRFDVAVEAPANQAKTFTLDGEVAEWHPGNRAKRLMVGMGSGRETAKIHYWLTDASGKKVFEHTDTIRAAFWGNGYADSVGQLAQPFADKIADRLAEAKL
jgi:Domain of unknown function (DUF4410)